MHGSLFHPEEVDLARASPAGLIQYMQESKSTLINSVHTSHCQHCCNSVDIFNQYRSMLVFLSYSLQMLHN